MYEQQSFNDDLDNTYSPVNISNNEKNELIETIGEIIYSYINENIRSIAEETFESKLLLHCNSILTTQLSHIYVSDIDDLIESIVNQAIKLCYSCIIPKRAYKRTFIRGLPNYNVLEKKINILKNILQPEQRTEEWYKFRYNLITASSAWKILHTESSINQIIYEKCAPLITPRQTSISLDSPLHWGQKYEPISVQIYEFNYTTEIADFGCIKHPKYSFLGASPDGINVSKDSKRYGRMLEIKNTVSRIITGSPKKEYWIQMQLQMETCDLNECDFLETSFKEYANIEEFTKDGTFNTTENGQIKGIFICFNYNNKYYYEYPTCPNFSESEYNTWEMKTMEKNKHATWIKNNYWYLNKYSCVLVLRNKIWFTSIIQDIEKVWKIILHERNNGYLHRAPKRKQKINNNTTTHNIIPKNKCLVVLKTDSAEVSTPLVSVSLPDVVDKETSLDFVSQPNAVCLGDNCSIPILIPIIINVSSDELSDGSDKYLSPQQDIDITIIKN